MDKLPTSQADRTKAVALVGRPSKYLPEYCDRLIAHCVDGASINTFAAALKVSRKTLTNWAAEHPEFADAFEVAKAQAASWWEARLRDVASGNGGPGAATAAVFGVKNFSGEDFQDRRQLEHVGHVDHHIMTHEQALEEARRRGLPSRVFDE